MSHPQPPSDSDDTTPATYGSPPAAPYEAVPSQGYPAPPGYTPQPPGYQPPQQGYAPPQQGYAPPQQSYPGHAPQAGYGGPPPPQAWQPNGRPAMLVCRNCGSVPAAAVGFRKIQGMVVLMRWQRYDGPFCRDCGLAFFRLATSRTLVQGWWGILAFFVTWVTLVENLGNRGKVAGLAAPQPNPYGPSRPPVDPGTPLRRRPSTWLGLGLPFLLVLLVIVNATLHS